MLFDVVELLGDLLGQLVLREVLHVVQDVLRLLGQLVYRLEFVLILLVLLVEELTKVIVRIFLLFTHEPWHRELVLLQLLKLVLQVLRCLIMIELYQCPYIRALPCKPIYHLVRFCVDLLPYMPPYVHLIRLRG